jgi:hypothetical protein
MFTSNLAEGLNHFDRSEPRERRASGNCYSIAPFWLYRRVAHTLSMYSSGLNIIPSLAVWTTILPVRWFFVPDFRWLAGFGGFAVFR